MLRLTFLLCIGMYAALMIAGVDRGQMRPGLAEAAAKAARQGVSDVSGTESASLTAAEEPVVRVASTALVEPVAEIAAAEPAPAEPAPYVEPVRELVTEVAEPVFSLASVGNETAPDAPAQPEVADGGTGTIWYVTASSVNVRAEPSTEAEVVGKLGSGEATLLVQAVNDEWARIVIQGDGVEGFVAMRYLSAEAP
jgi:uncharacterized protein YgiM (DUF1202 family)